MNEDVRKHLVRSQALAAEAGTILDRVTGGETLSRQEELKVAQLMGAAEQHLREARETIELS